MSFCKCIQTSQLSIVVGHSKFVVATSAQEYVHFEAEVELNHPYVQPRKIF